MEEQLPSSDQDKEGYERNKFELKSWKGTIRYPAPPQELWNNAKRELPDLCGENNIPQWPDFEHKYLAALLAAMGEPTNQQVEGLNSLFQTSKQSGCYGWDGRNHP